MFYEPNRKQHRYLSGKVVAYSFPSLSTLGFNPFFHSLSLSLFLSLAYEYILGWDHCRKKFFIRKKTPMDGIEALMSCIYVNRDEKIRQILANMYISTITEHALNGQW
ncbi:hypothetical protein AAMO2058_000924400 [Amorphochlora amoebiformis]